MPSRPSPRRFALVTALPIEECRRRLQANIHRWRAGFGGGEIVGWIRGDRMRFSKAIRYRNSFQPHLFATMYQAGTGTHLRCRIGLHPFVLGFLLLWLWLLLPIAGGALISVFKGRPASAPGPEGGDFAFAAVPVAMIVFAALLVWAGRTLARKEREFLVAFLRRTLEAGFAPSTRATGPDML